MKLTTAGESHGRALVAIIEGIPAHLHIDTEKINAALALRQQGFGRGGRQKIEKDKAEILSGVRNEETLGSPITLCIFNKDYENWQASMSAGKCDPEAMQSKALTKVRPGHADLTGMLKYAQEDARNILERASARETAIRVAAGEVFRAYLSELGVEVGGYVREICGIRDDKEYEFSALSAAKTTQTGMLDSALENLAMEKIKTLRAAGDTAGGVVEVRVKGLKCGFGSTMTYGEKLDGLLARDLMSIQAVKGVEFGDGFAVAHKSGKEVHDEIYVKEGNLVRRTNRAGGIEGGMSNGEELVVRIAMKPIPTLISGLTTVDMATGEQAQAASERSDACAIFALEIIAEAVVCKVLADAIAKRVGGDTMAEVISRYELLPKGNI